MKFNDHPDTGDSQKAEEFRQFFSSQFVSYKNYSKILDFSNAVCNYLDFTVDDVWHVQSNCSSGSGPDNIQGSNNKSTANSKSIHFWISSKTVISCIVRCEYKYNVESHYIKKEQTHDRKLQFDLQVLVNFAFALKNSTFPNCPKSLKHSLVEQDMVFQGIILL